MVIFWAIAVLLIFVGLKAILPPLRRPSRIAAGTTLAEANAAVYRRQIAELDADVGHGLITRTQFERDRRELERRALVDLSSAEPPRSKPQPAVGSATLVVCLAIGLPVAAIVAYLALGAPEAIWR
jgi:cytochrome c-type biogenesis protein CcmH